jgi:hypothetical protein
VISAGVPAIRNWWPGNNYVTWAGIDGYLTAPSHSQRPSGRKSTCVLATASQLS